MTKARYLFIVFVLAILSSGLGAAETQFKVGERYAPVRKQQPAGEDGKIEVIEVFWYGCPHCYHFEPYLNRWLEALPDDVTFRRVPAVFRQSWLVHAKAYYSAEELGVVDRVHGPLFEAIHEHKRAVHDEDGLARFFAEQGVDEQAFRETFKSFGIDSLARKAALLSRDYGIPGVPSMIVNGKYFTSGGMAGGYPELLKVVDFLVDRERAGGPATH
jgi:thiol:disulfide interchange protein DsbA